MNIDLLNIWKCLADNDVRYLTIGGFAVNFYGYSRTTGDIDLLIDDSLDNRKKLRHAFKDMGLGDFKEIETVQFIPGWSDFVIDQGMRLDIMTSIKGFDKDTFNDLYQTSQVTYLSDVPIRFIDYQNLVIAKKATDRPKDRLDVEEMEKVKRWDEEDKGSEP